MSEAQYAERTTLRRHIAHPGGPLAAEAVQVLDHREKAVVGGGHERLEVLADERVAERSGPKGRCHRTAAV